MVDAGLNTQLMVSQGSVIQMEMQTRKDLVALQEDGVEIQTLTANATAVLISLKVSIGILLLKAILKSIQQIILVGSRFFFCHC